MTSKHDEQALRRAVIRKDQQEEDWIMNIPLNVCKPWWFDVGMSLVKFWELSDEEVMKLYADHREELIEKMRRALAKDVGPAEGKEKKLDLEKLGLKKPKPRLAIRRLPNG
jgi:hypothetical protein